MSNNFQDKNTSRRNFILGLAGAGLLTAGCNNTSGAVPGVTSGKPSPTSPLKADEETDFEKSQDFSDLDIGDRRTLVYIELFGGNQGFAMFPYASNGAFNSKHGVEGILPYDNEIGFHQDLVDLAEYADKMAIVEGIGHMNNNLSHFTMRDRWHLCDSEDSQNYSKGFLARTSEALAAGNDGLVAASTTGYTLAMAGGTAPFLAASSLDQVSFLSDPAFAEYREAVSSFDGDAKELGAIYQSIYQTKNQFPAVPTESPVWAQLHGEGAGGDLGKQLQIASYLIKADVGTQIIHVTVGGFDTHGGFGFEYPKLMEKVNIAVSGFLKDIEEAGVADKVTVAFASEFGRRLASNGLGSDHGNTSTTCVIGNNVKPGRYGQKPSFTNLDSSDNVKAEVPFDNYLASLAQGCLGVPADRLLTQSTEQLDMFV